MNAKELGAQAVSAGAYEYGLTKRELFAAMVMQGLLSDRENCSVFEGLFTPETCAAIAVDMADALLAELAKDQP